FAVTRATATLEVTGHWHRDDGGNQPIIVHGVPFDHVAAPCKPVVGVVRDQDTGRPIAGAVVETYQLAGRPHAGEPSVRAVTARDGRYRLTGLPKEDGHPLRAARPAGQPYLTAERRVADSPGLEPVTVDFELKRGVWLSGKVTDKVTGKPVYCQVQY